ncbi:hypothetical protein Q3G72_015038 [Acer saccharum]|nr:hypothetical protein Q3G72_015038 [Acer saccharum]
MQQLENEKKITKLEVECEKLRLFILEKLRSIPVALEKMKGKAKMRGNDQMEIRRRERWIHSRDLIVKETPKETSPDISLELDDPMSRELCKGKKPLEHVDNESENP